MGDDDGPNDDKEAEEEGEEAVGSVMVRSAARNQRRSMYTGKQMFVFFGTIQLCHNRSRCCRLIALHHANKDPNHPHQKKHDWVLRSGLGPTVE